jgi:oligopeptide transport system ATP-binding protein
VGYWLHRVGLRPDYAARYPHEFSGGQKQRLCIARALAVEPRFVICDEPLSALDVSVQAQIVMLLRQIQEEFGLTYLLIAHSLPMVRYAADRTAVMYLGRIMEAGPAQTVLAKPCHPYTEALVAANPSPDPRLKRKWIGHLLPGEVISRMDRNAGCVFEHRCRRAGNRCKEETPQLQEIEPGHSVACHSFEAR